MKKILALLLIAGFLILAGCALDQPVQSTITTVKPGELALTKVVFVGNSLTAGFQSAGLVEDLQANSFPALIYNQMGQGSLIEQPLVDNPGISSTPGVGVLDFDPATGAISPRGTYTEVEALLLNPFVARPYDNLGVPGAKLKDVLETVDASGGNPFFDLILRNPNFGNMTQVEQASVLNPTVVVAWIGCNDVLGAALSGGDPNLITPAADFQADYTGLILELGKIRGGDVGIMLANIPNVTDIPYVNLLDGLIYKAIPALGINAPVPVVFDASFNPVLFDTAMGLYLPLLADEGLLTGGSPIEHLLLPFLSEYSANGLGIPDSTVIANTLISVGIDPTIAAATAQQLVQGMIAAGLNPSGVPIPGTLTITGDEEATLLAAVQGFNQVIAGIAGSVGIPVIDANAKMSELNQSGIDGFTGRYVFFDPANTAFSLDGIHPNNGGNAIIANEFIKVMNQFPDINLPLIDTQQFKGQYTGGSGVPKTITYKAALQAKAIFTDY
jgi:lysophospholipase L1-like esterase